MRRNIALYINGQQADLENDSIIQFSYTREDLTDPAIVKNSYSQQVTLPSTPRNNKIFGHIANADRATSTGFNALVRTPFIITEDGNIIESGYLKLDSIQRKGASLVYTVSLYGGLGSFFYNLSYTEDGQSLTLADLDYMEGEKLDFRIYKTAVTQAWAELASGKAYDKASRWQIINFAPAYNGIPSDDFDADKALCDPALTVYPPSYLDDDGEEWVASNFVEMSREYNEWQVKDLRSYMQRPVMRMRSVIEACCDPTQNGGYTVTLDPTFFNNDNPYYDKVWFSLPILRTLELASEDGEESVSYDGGFSNNGEKVVMAVNYKANIEGASATINVNATHILRTSGNFAEGQRLLLGYKTGGAVTTTDVTYTLRALDINGNIIFSTIGTSACVYQWSQSQNVGIGGSCELSIANMTNVAAIELVAEIGGYNNGWNRNGGVMPIPVCSDDHCVNRYELGMEQKLAAKDSEIALLKANTYNDQKILDVYRYFDGKIAGIEARLAEQAVRNQGVTDAFREVQKDIDYKVNLEAERRCCADNRIVEYVNGTFAPKLIADYTAGTTTTAATTYNPLCCNCNNRNSF